MSKSNRRRCAVSGGEASAIFYRGTAEALESRFLLSGTWDQVTQTLPEGADTMLLLTNGVVMIHGGGGTAVASNKWYELTPSSSASDANRYKAGSLSRIQQNMAIARLDFSSAVLPSGKVFRLSAKPADSCVSRFIRTHGAPAV